MLFWEFHFWGVIFRGYPTKTTDIREIPAKWKSNNLWTIEDRQSLSMKHRYKHNWGHSFRIHHRQLCTTLPSGDITMTPFPVCKKVSLSRKRCTIEVILLFNTDRKLVSLIQNSSLKTVYNAPYRRFYVAVISAFRENLILSETAHDRWKLSM